MKTMKLCPECGKVLAPEAPLGLCPECLLKAGLGAEPLPLPLPQPQPPAAGGRVSYFGDYELIEEIARGGMGVVWKARQVSLNRLVAVKMILSGHLAGDAEVKRFRTEAEAAAKLQHPNIVAIHEVGEHEGQHYFSMDFVEGQSLAEMVFHRPLSPEKAAEYLKAIAEAIQYAHEKGVLHRDLKPSNVLVDHAGKPRVTDFGLAKLVERDSGTTHSGAVMGSPSYMSPEQASGKTREVGAASDVYSLGAILYELITGRPPFQAATPLDTMRMVVESETAAPKWVNPAVPADLETICLKCLEKDPQRRYRSARELAEDLGRFLGHEPIQARPATRLYRAEKWIKRKPATAALLGVIAAALLVLTAGGWRYAVSLRKSGIEINERLRQTLVEQARAERLLGHREAALQRITEAAKIRRTAELRTEAIQAIAQPGVRNVFDAPIGAVAVSRFSADGKLLAVGGDGYVTPDWPGYASNAWQTFVRVWEVPSGRPLGMWPWHLEAGPFALSPDSGLLALPQTNENGAVELALWNVVTGNVTARLPVSGPSQFSPDGKYLAVQGSNRVSVWSVGSAGFSPLQATNAHAAPTIPAALPASPGSGMNAALHESAAVILAWTAPDELLLQQLPKEGHGRLFHWNVATGQETFPLNDTAYVRPDRSGPARPLEGYSLDRDTEVAVAVSADGRAAATRRLIARIIPEELFIRDLDSGNLLGTVRPSPFPDSMLLSAHGRRLVFPDVVEQGRMRVYDVNSERFFPGVGEPGASLATMFERIEHGQVTGSGSSGSGTNFMRYESRWLKPFYSGRPSPNIPWISAVQNFSPDGALFATELGGTEPGVSLWELDSGRRVLAMPNARRPVWSADGHWLAVEARGTIRQANGASSSGDIAQLWEVLRGVPTHRLRAAPRVLAFSPDGGKLTANLDSSRGSVLWNIDQNSAGLTLRTTSEKLADKEILFRTNQTWVLNDAQYSLVGSLAQAERLGAKDKPYSMEDKSWVLGRALSPDGRRLLIACNAVQSMTNGTPVNGPHLQLWDLVERRRVAVWPHPGTDPKYGAGWKYGSLVFSPDGRRVASGCYGPSGIEIWDTGTGKRLHELHQPLAPPFPPPEKPSAIIRRILKSVFRMRSDPPSLWPGPQYTEYSVAALGFTPDSRLVISCAEERAVIREVESGRELVQCRGATNMLCLAISPDGRTLATGDEEHLIRLWEIPSGRELAHWPAGEAAVTALTFSPDGATLASGARDSTMKLWNLPFLRAELKKLGLEW